jgi:hypothetical protein
LGINFGCSESPDFSSGWQSGDTALLLQFSGQHRPKGNCFPRVCHPTIVMGIEHANVVTGIGNGFCFVLKKGIVMA